MGEEVDRLAPAAPTTAEIYLHLDKGLRAVSPTGVDLLPRARKARALLTMIALSPDGYVLRSAIIATLWSQLERSRGLGCLRDSLHHIRQAWTAKGIRTLFIEGEKIGFVSSTVRIRVDYASSDSSKFLIDFDGVDPMLDQWLDRVREQLWHTTRVGEVESSRGSLPAAYRSQCPTIAISELSVIDSEMSPVLAASLTTELAAALSKLRWFPFVTVSDSEYDVYGNNVQVPAHVRYHLSGQVRRVQNSLRLVLRMVDLRMDRKVVWATIVEGGAQGASDAMQEMATSVSASLGSELLLIEADRLRAMPPSAIGDAYSLVVSAVPHVCRLEREPFFRAGHLLDLAVRNEPDFAMAHCWLALWEVFHVGQGWSLNPTRSMKRAQRAAERAVVLDHLDGTAVTVLGHVRAFLDHQLDEAATLHAEALRINPGLAIAWTFCGMTHAYRGDLTQAAECLRYAAKLAPNSPHSYLAWNGLAVVHLLRHEHADALTLSTRVTQAHPYFTSAIKTHLAALGHLGMGTLAVKFVDRLKVIEPGFSLRRFRSTGLYQRTEDVAHFVAGLRLAGVN